MLFTHTALYPSPRRERAMALCHLRDEESEAQGSSKTSLRGTPLEMGRVQADPKSVTPHHIVLNVGKEEKKERFSRN